MTTREFVPKGAPAGQGRQRIVLELEPSGLVSWRLWEGFGPGALDLSGTPTTNAGGRGLTGLPLNCWQATGKN